MAGGSGTKLSNGIARSKIDLPKVCFKNVQSSFVEPYKASKIPNITNTTPLRALSCDLRASGHA
jgi:hypothetical protein